MHAGMQQLSVINRTRNDLIHLGIRARRGSFLITNEMFATSRAKLRRLHMDFKDFQLIQTDLEWIIWKLMQLGGMLDVKQRPSMTREDKFAFDLARAVRTSLRKHPSGEWNYTPRLQASRPRKSRAKSPRPNAPT